jgi:hypothetical protein
MESSEGLLATIIVEEGGRPEGGSVERRTRCKSAESRYTSRDLAPSANNLEAPPDLTILY